MDELKAHFPEEVKAAQATADAVQFKPDEAEAILALAFMELTKVYTRWKEKYPVTGDEADRWAKCTRIVFWKHMQSMEAGVVVWALLTTGIMLGKEDLPTKKKKGVLKNADAQAKPSVN